MQTITFLTLRYVKFISKNILFPSYALAKYPITYTDIFKSTSWLQQKMLRNKMVINHTQVFSCKTWPLPCYLACTAISTASSFFFPKEHLLPIWMLSITKKSNDIRSFTIKEQTTITSISYYSCSLWCSQRETLLVSLNLLVLAWSHALVHQLTTSLNSCAHLRRDPAECPNASYCESSANKTSCMSSWCALLLESHKLCGKLFIFPAVSSPRTSVQLL